jgi:hypothetical protein
MAKINISKGLHTQDTLHLRARKDEEEVRIETYGEAENIDLLIDPKGTDGRVIIDEDVIIKNGIMDLSELNVADLNVVNQNILTYSHMPGVTGQLFYINYNLSGTVNGVQGDGEAGIVIERGSYPNVRLVFDESDDRWKVGDNVGTETLALISESDEKYAELAKAETFLETISFTDGISVTGDIGLDEQFYITEDGISFNNNSAIFTCEEFQIGNVTSTTSVTISGSITTTGQVTISGGLNVKGNTQVEKIFVNNIAEFQDDVTFNQDATFEGEVYLTTSGGPVSPSGAGTPGQVRWDEEYLFLCYKSDRWGRIPLEKSW